MFNRDVHLCCNFLSLDLWNMFQIEAVLWNVSHIFAWKFWLQNVCFEILAPKCLLPNMFEQKYKKCSMVMCTCAATLSESQDYLHLQHGEKDIKDFALCSAIILCERKYFPHFCTCFSLYLQHRERDIKYLALYLAIILCERTFLFVFPHICI